MPSKASRSVREMLEQAGHAVKAASKSKHKRHIAGRMNGTETKFSQLFLEPLITSGEILSWSFEGTTFRLCPSTTYTPDFRVILKDQTLLFFEVKGSWKAADQGKSRIKLKWCAKENETHRFASYEFKRHKLEWFGPNAPVQLSVFRKK